VRVRTPIAPVSAHARSPGRHILASGLAAVLVAAATSFPATAGPASEPPGGKAIRTLVAIRNEQVVRQQWDYSCGAAAIATVLTYQLNHPVTERQVALGILRHEDAKLVRARLGFSLLDLKLYAATQGFAAAGFGQMSLDDLDGMAPAIVPIRVHGFRHFVVYRGRRGDRVLIADPSFGNRTLPTDTFKKVWANNVAFVVFNPSDPHPPNRMGAPAELFLAPASRAGSPTS
jgi:predicted double-glycine peptidase